MSKLSLVLLLVCCSTFFCQASPIDKEPVHQNAPVPQEPASHSEVKSTSSPATVVVPQKETGTAKVDVTTTTTSEPKIPSNVTPFKVDKDNTSTTANPHNGSSTTTTTPVSTTSTTTPVSTTKSTTTPPPPPPTSTKPTSPSPPHSTSTIPPQPTTPQPKPKPNPDGGFNLISFLGGMILGLGLLAIGYVIFKFYQTRRDSSYRTL